MNKKLRIAVDSGMVLLLPLLMEYSLVGETAHEYLGIGMSLLFVAHHILNVAWWKHLLRGKYTPLRILGTAIDLALVVIMLALPISGMILSRYVFRFSASWWSSHSKDSASTGFLLGIGANELPRRYARQ